MPSDLVLLSIPEQTSPRGQSRLRKAVQALMLRLQLFRIALWGGRKPNMDLLLDFPAGAALADRLRKYGTVQHLGEFASSELYGPPLQVRASLLATAWYRTANWNPTHEGVHVLECLDQAASYFCMNAIEDAMLLARALDERKPSRVRSLSETFAGGMAPRLAAERNLAFVAPKLNRLAFGLRRSINRWRARTVRSYGKLQTSRAEPCDILWVPLQPSTYPNLLRVARVLQEKESFKQQVLFTGPDSKMEDVVSKAGLDAAFMNLPRLSRSGHATIQHIVANAPRYASERNASGWPADVRPFAPVLAQWIAMRFPIFVKEAVQLIEAFRSVMAVARPRCVVTFQDKYLPGRICVDVARQFGAKTIVLHNGHVEEFPLVTWLTIRELREDESRPLDLDIAADIWATYGPRLRANLVRLGVVPEKLCVTGMPRFDALLDVDPKKSRARIASTFRLAPETRIALLATQHPALEDRTTLADRLALARAVAEACKRRSCVLLVRCHPNEDPSPYQEMAKAWPHVHFCPPGISLYDLVAACDVLVTGFSTTAVEAMILDKPVITVNLGRRPDPMPFAESGAALRAHSAEEMDVALDRALSGQEDEDLRRARQGFLQEHYANIGRASEATAALIAELAGGAEP